MAKALALLILVLGNILLTGAARARLGENEIQCEDRYGLAKREFAALDKTFPIITGEGAISKTYLYQGWRIRVGFLYGIAVREQYWKVTEPGRSLILAEYESNAILEGERGSSAWTPKGAALSFNPTKALQNYLSSALMGTSWVRADGAAVANLDLGKMHMSFDSLAAIEHDEAGKRANEAKQRASVPAF